MSIKSVQDSNPDAAELLNLLAVFADKVPTALLRQGAPSPDLPTCPLREILREESRFDTAVAMLLSLSLAEMTTGGICVQAAVNPSLSNQSNGQTGTLLLSKVLVMFNQLRGAYSRSLPSQVIKEIKMNLQYCYSLHKRMIGRNRGSFRQSGRLTQSWG
jgi:hypothetical protein